MRFVSVIGIVAILAICFLLSRDRRAISWRLVGVGVLLQALFGVTFLFWSGGNAALQAVGRGFDWFLQLGQAGSEFVFGPLATGNNDLGFVFAFQILPTLIFFSSFMAVLYHLGVMQLVVRGMAWVMVRVLGTSGSESLSACANVFVGQTEAPLLVKPFLKNMTMSELHTVMVGGFCTIAGGVFALYVQFVGGDDPVARAEIAGHLMVASVMAVPAGLVCSKLLWPETEQSETMGTVARTEKSPYSNTVEAAAGGASDGLKLALNVGGMLIAFLALIAVINAALGIFPGTLTIEELLGWLFWPIAALMGVPGEEINVLAQLIGTKLVATELVAYSNLGEMVTAGEVSPRTKMIASFALCGFASFGGVAIQIGGLGAMAPERRSDLARIGLRAMFAGALATCMTACVAGVLMIGHASPRIAGADQAVVGGVEVTLGDPAAMPGATSHAWRQIGGIQVALAGADGARPTFRAPDVAGAHVLTFEATWSDGSEPVVDTASVTVSPPLADAGSDQKVGPGSTVILDAGRSQTGAGEVAWSWRQVGGPRVELRDASTVRASFTAPAAAAPIELEFEVQVRAGGVTATDTATVRIEVPVVR